MDYDINNAIVVIGQLEYERRVQLANFTRELAIREARIQELEAQLPATDEESEAGT